MQPRIQAPCRHPGRATLDAIKNERLADAQSRQGSAENRAFLRHCCRVASVRPESTQPAIQCRAARSARSRIGGLATSTQAENLRRFGIAQQQLKQMYRELHARLGNLIWLHQYNQKNDCAACRAEIIRVNQSFSSTPRASEVTGFPPSQERRSVVFAPMKNVGSKTSAQE